MTRKCQPLAPWFSDSVYEMKEGQDVMPLEGQGQKAERKLDYELSSLKLEKWWW